MRTSQRVRVLGRRRETARSVAQSRALVVEVGELVDRERAAEPAAQLGLDRLRHPLEHALLVRRRLGEPPQALLPLRERVVEVVASGPGAA